MPWYGGVVLGAAGCLGLLAASWAGLRPWVRPALLVLAVAAGAWRWHRLDEAATHRRAERLAFVQELRQMRPEWPASGAAVATTPAVAALVVYHARRPVLLSRQAASSAAPGTRAALELLAELDAAAFVAGLRASGAGVLVSGSLVRDEARALRLSADCALARLPVGGVQDPIAVPAGLRLARAAAGFELWELEAAAAAPAGPRIRAR